MRKMSAPSDKLGHVRVPWAIEKNKGGKVPINPIHVEMRNGSTD
jgi:hypothetical protein